MRKIRVLELEIAVSFERPSSFVDLKSGDRTVVSSTMLMTAWSATTD